MTDAEAISQAQRDLGRQLAAYRAAAGYNQTQFAAFTGYSRSTLANVETGRQVAPRWFWERCDERLGTGGALIVRYDEVEHLKEQRKQGAVRALEAERKGRLRNHQTQRAAAISDDGSYTQAVRSEWSGDLTGIWQAAVTLWNEEFDQSRLDVGDALASSALALHWLVAAADTGTARDAGWRRVGLSDVERIRGVRRQLKAMDNAHGGGATFPMAVVYLRREVTPLLDGRYDDATGRALFSAVAELSLDAEEMGWMAYDAGGHQLGRRYMGQALRLAHAADDRLFGGRVLAALSHQALHLGYIHLAVDLARAARTGTTSVAPPKAVAMLAAMEAMTEAADHEPSRCTTALAVAEKALDQARTTDDGPDWLDFDEGGLWGHAARAHRYLKNGKASARYAEDSITRCASDHGRTHAQREAILASAYLQLGQLDQAAALGSHLVTKAWNLHSRHVYEEVAFLARALDGRRARGTRDFLDQAREYLVARRLS